MSEGLRKLETVEEFFLRGVWFLEFDIECRLTAVSIKCTPTGKLAILKAITAEGPQVAFCGADEFAGLWRKLNSAEGRSKLKWKPDCYALDKK